MLKLTLHTTSTTQASLHIVKGSKFTITSWNQITISLGFHPKHTIDLPATFLGDHGSTLFSYFAMCHRKYISIDGDLNNYGE